MPANRAKDGSTVVDLSRSFAWAYQARVVGSDAAPLYGTGKTQCQSPVTVILKGRPDKAAMRLGIDKDTTVNVDLDVRCRKCPNCLRARSYHWAERARHEIAASSRTWFATLTLSPERQSRLVMEAEFRLARQRVDYAALCAADPFDAWRERIKPLGREMTLYLKRLRKQASGLRYILVVEKHKSGAPHVHALIHEHGSPIRHADLSRCWHWGFSNFKLVDVHKSAAAARYVSKYLSKDITTRVRASGGYGHCENFVPAPLNKVPAALSESSERCAEVVTSNRTAHKSASELLHSEGGNNVELSD